VGVVSVIKLAVRRLWSVAVRAWTVGFTWWITGAAGLIPPADVVLPYLVAGMLAINAYSERTKLAHDDQ